MISFPNAKVNLGLRILKKRDDGYHDIETVMYPVNYFDALEIIAGSSRKFSLASSGIGIRGSRGNNLCAKAYMLMKEKYDLPPVMMHIHKCIPMGSGLGGGSSDAAFTLKMLNSLFGLNLDKASLKELAAAIGSDCPFFIENRAALARGKGERLEGLNLSLDAYHIMIIKPPVHLDTAMAYAEALPSEQGRSLKELVRLPVMEWKHNIFNDFEQYAFKKYPGLGRIKKSLYDHGAVYASLTGSGSALYAIFDHHPPPIEADSGSVIWTGRLE